MEKPSVRPAATVVLMRESAGGYEVLLTVRPKHLRFMGGAAVFPGGAVSTADSDPRWDGLTRRPPEDAARVLAEPDERVAQAAHVAALREAHEEVGLLLADGPAERLRRDVDDAGFLAGCAALGLTLRTDLLTPAGRWVTPLGAPVRFDTHFFLAPVPEGWEPHPDPNEVERCLWVRPADALEQVTGGGLMMAPPTVEMLQRLSASSSPAEATRTLGDEPLDGPGKVLSALMSPLVRLVLAPNPGLMTGPGTNTYIVGTGPHCVIDPAVDDPDYLDAVVAAAPDTSAILVTHRHGDHVGGAARLAARTGAPVRAFGDARAGGAAVTPLADGEVLSFGSATLRALHAPGHASDHLCFLMEGAATLFAGDNVLGEGTAVIAPPDGNMRAYLATLRRLAQLDIDRIYPGHFRPLDGGRAVIEGYIEHRRQRTEQVMSVLRDGPRSATEIVTTVYAEVATDLHPVAVLQTEALLEMLAEDGVVHRRDGRWFVSPAR